jgi:hypothetical protein
MCRLQESARAKKKEREKTSGRSTAGDETSEALETSGKRGKSA